MRNIGNKVVNGHRKGEELRVGYKVKILDDVWIWKLKINGWKILKAGQKKKKIEKEGAR